MSAKSLAAALMVTGFSSAAMAGNPMPAPVAGDVVAVPPMVEAVTDWSGFYMGGSVSFHNGTITSDSNVSDPLAGNEVYGAFAGYNMQRGNLVFGGELAYLATAANFATFNSTFTDGFDLKGRVGYALGRALVYGTVGYSTTAFNDLSAIPPVTGSLAGMSYGVGVDFKLGNRMFVGVEYLSRNMSGSLPLAPTVTFTNQAVNTVSVRAGINF